MSDELTYTYRWIRGPIVDGQLLDEMAGLYSNHYGVWRAGTPNSFRRIRLSTRKLREWLIHENSHVFYATVTATNELVGYAVAIVPKVPGWGTISWVTQLVVHEEHRRREVAKRILFSIWGFSDHFAWGLVTANPFAVRALEKATRRRCDPKLIARFGQKLADFGRSNVAYLAHLNEWKFDELGSHVNSDFPIDHSGLPVMLLDACRNDVPWTLGELPDDWEWFAFTFRRQEEIALTAEELEAMVQTSDEVAKVAYSRMRLTGSHRWASHTKREVDLIIAECDLEGSGRILDIGCGSGRHVIELASRGYDCVGIDYLPTERRYSTNGPGRAKFQTGDARDVDLGQEFDAVLCLYDVVGSYAIDEDNDRILRSIRRHLRPGGRALISVMNLELTLKRNKRSFSLRRDAERLLELPASSAMETTGDVFDPEYYMIDEDQEIVYRKEQFKEGDELPVELLVRDRRYRRRDIIAKCLAVGLSVIWSRYVRAGHWDKELGAEDDHAKEILLLCEARD